MVALKRRHFGVLLATFARNPNLNPELKHHVRDL